METLKDEYLARWQEHAETETWSEQDEAIRLLTLTGELMEVMFGASKAALSMALLGETVRHGAQGEWTGTNFPEVCASDDWKTIWSTKDGMDDTCHPVFFAELMELNAFSRFGIFPCWSEVDSDGYQTATESLVRHRVEELADVPAWIERVCSRIDQLEALTPAVAVQSGAIDNLLSTRLRARARLKLDMSKPLTVHELAALSDVSVKRLQNAIYAKTDEAPRVDKNGLISPEACEPWLMARDYYPSIWKDIVALYPLVSGWGEQVVLNKSAQSGVAEDYIFIPVANDGSEFTPDLARRMRSNPSADGFTIGAKGDEQVIADYPTALAELHRMDVPRWRRPNPESGNWGIVTGQSWRRVRLSSLIGGDA